MDRPHPAEVVDSAVAPTVDTTDTAPTTPPGPDCDAPGMVCVVAGVPGLQAYGAEGLPATESALNLPVDVTVSPDGLLYVVDYNNHRIRRIEADGTIVTVTGTGFVGDGVAADGGGDGQSGPPMSFAWEHPTDVSFRDEDPTAFYVAAWHNSRVNRVDLSADWVDLLWGTGSRAYGGDGGAAAAADFDLVTSVAWDDDGDAWVTDQVNQVIRRVSVGDEAPEDAIVETAVGEPKTAGYAGDGGPAVEALLHAYVGSHNDPSNKIEVAGRCLWIADTENQVVRMVDLDTLLIDRVAGVYVDDGFGSGEAAYGGDGGPALEARLNGPTDVAVGPHGEIYIADTHNHCVRVVTPDGIIHTFAGQCTVAADAAVDPLAATFATDALFDGPYGIDVDGTGNVYVADTHTQTIRRVAAGALPAWDTSIEPTCLPTSLPPPAQGMP